MLKLSTDSPVKRCVRSRVTDIAKDLPSLLLLLLLYTLQGVPIGLSASVPFILQSKVHGILSTTLRIVEF